MDRGDELNKSRRLAPIEIAEGALLADVAVLCQLVWTYLPLPGFFFRFLIPAIFTVIVLRRRLSAGILALAVAVFVAGVVTGPNLFDLLYLGLEGVGGLFLGVVMQRRWGHLAILTLGTLGLTASSLAVGALTIVIFVPLAEVTRGYEQLVKLAFGTMDSLTTAIGSYAVWRSEAYPIAATVAAFMLKYWWLMFIANTFVVAVPTMILMYFLTNLLVRLLGHEVRPFPGGFLHRLARRWTRRLVRLGLRRGTFGRRHLPA